MARTTSTPVPTGKTSPLEAGIAFDAALQLWKDASSQAARDKFAEAARLDPSLAVAHVLFAAAAQYIDPSSRTHLAQARALRTHLTPSQASLLQALEPLEAEPPDIAEATRRFDIHLDQFPGEWTSWAARGVHDLRTKQPARVRDTIQHMSGALPLWLKGRAELLQGNTPSARATLEDCARQFPQAIDCLSFLARLEANEGRCEVSASIARQLIAQSPQSSEGFDALARAELGRTHETKIALAALEEKWTRVAPDRKDVDEARDRYFLEIHDGHMSAALVAADRWEKAAAKASVYAFARAFPIISRLGLELELGEGDAAVRSAQALVHRSSSWLRSDFFDVPVEITRALYLTGQIDREQLRARQAREDQDLLARGGYFDSEVRWLEVYAQSVQDREDAENALEHRPPADHDLDPAFRDPSVDLRMGRTLFLAGRLEDSLELLRRARGACTLYRALEQVQAATLYGKALAAAGRTREACAEFESVLKRWGEEPRSRSVQAALAEGHHLGCTVRSMKRKGKA